MQRTECNRFDGNLKLILSTDCNHSACQPAQISASTDAHNDADDDTGEKEKS